MGSEPIPGSSYKKKDNYGHGKIYKTFRLLFIFNFKGMPRSRPNFNDDLFQTLYNFIDRTNFI